MAREHPARRLLAFAVLLLLLLGGGALAGAVADPERATPRAAGGGHGDAHEEAAPAAAPVRGLAVAEGGLRLALETPELRRDVAQSLRFRVLDARGRAVRAFDVEHERRMHLIVVRRDLTGFQHVHPRMAPDGTWTVAVRLPTAGSFRVFADFSHAGRPRTLAADVRVDGAADLRALPAPATIARTDGGLDVRLEAPAARPGVEATLRFAVSRAGRPVRVERFLGAGGHLVALREGDLAFLHVHPTEHDGAAFAATFPTAGRYRLFLQVQVAGQVHTAAFTREVAA